MPKKTISVPAKRYEDYDDCLTAAAEDYASEHPEAEGYDLSPRWEDDERDVILLDVPAASGEIETSFGSLIVRESRPRAALFLTPEACRRLGYYEGDGGDVEGGPDARLDMVREINAICRERARHVTHVEVFADGTPVDAQSWVATEIEIWL